tara:strand:+ start:5165 stop:5344 length:180 start_codon:yes stop_codon:yes gene_type:complete
MQRQCQPCCGSNSAQTAEFEQKEAAREHQKTGIKKRAFKDELQFVHGGSPAGISKCSDY